MVSASDGAAALRRAGGVAVSGGATDGGTVICIAEDRRAEEVGVRLLVQSVLDCVPSARIMLWCPRPSDDLSAWLSSRPSVALRLDPLEGGGSWNVKAAALLAALDAGADAAWWVDSDVIVTQDFVRRYGAASVETLHLCQEAAYGSKDGDGIRARGWAFVPQRTYPDGLNSAVLRVTRAHVPLLRAWMEKLGDAAYQAWQRRPVHDRPPHMLGDQDVLTALLCGPFHQIPLRVLRLGVDVIQYLGPSGFTLAERWQVLRHRLPPFIHSQGALKPWRTELLTGRPSSLRERFDRLCAESSPYLGAARRVRTAVGADMWRRMSRRSRLGRVLLVLGFGSIPLTGAPLAIAYAVIAGVSRLRTGSGARRATIDL